MMASAMMNKSSFTTSSNAMNNVLGRSSRRVASSSSSSSCLSFRSSRNNKVKKSSAMIKAAMIEEEVALDEAPLTLLRPGGEGDANEMRAKFEKMVRQAQNDICKAVEELDGGKFHEDAWERPGGGGGISRVLQGGKVFEKAGINVSVVYGQMPPEAYRAATGGQGAGTETIPFFAAGISSVMHPINPMAPTVHFNYRYFETDSPRDDPGAPRAWWFGGGTDLTPSYIFHEDVAHFHGTLKGACDKHDPEYYPRFKQWADDYFMIKHRGERRGVGGVFFDDMNDRPKEELLAFATDMAQAVVPAYIPLVDKHKDDSFTQEEKDWQQMRRGRYVEFNLVYDRGTTFGLKTGGRIESILMSLPLTARWQYDMHPKEGSREADALDAFMNPRTWLA